MSRYEKGALLVLIIAVFSSSFFVVLWSIKDLDKLYSDLVLGLVAGPLIGYFSGKYITLYYRQRDKNDRIAYAIYGLQIHLRKISTRLDDLIKAEKNIKASTRNKMTPRSHVDRINQELLRDRLRETLHDEPYSIFLDLDDNNLGEPYRESRIEACMVIAQLENLILYNNSWPSYMEMLVYRKRIVLARSALLRLKNNFK